MYVIVMYGTYVKIANKNKENKSKNTRVSFNLNDSSLLSENVALATFAEKIFQPKKLCSIK